MKIVGRCLAAAWAVSLVTGAWAQNDAGVIMREGKVTQSALIEALDPPERLRNIRVEATGEKPKPAAVSLLITFQTNSAELTPQAKQSLDVLGGALNSDRLHDVAFQIEGHADPRGEEDINQKLSEARAGSVRAYLMQAQNIDQSRLKAVGMGERFPVRPEDPAAEENRRVTFKALER
jgi:OmpA-OmpF porin, OOP family